MGAVPSPDERIIGDLGHPVDVSVTVNVTGKGTAPEFGVTESEALVLSLAGVVVGSSQSPKAILYKSHPSGGVVVGGT